jgi:hypothetical protein
VPDVDLARLQGLSEQDLRLLSQDFDERGQSWIGNNVSIARLARTADNLDVTLAEASRKIARLGWLGLELPPVDTSTLDELEFSKPIPRHMLWPFTRSDAMPSQVALAAFWGSTLLRSAVDLASRLGILSAAIHAGFDAIQLERKPDKNDVHILQAFERAPGRDSETRRRRGRATARFFLWQISDEDLDAAIDRLGPIVDHIINNPRLDPAA